MRQLEEADSAIESERPKKKKAVHQEVDPHIKRYEETLQEAFSTPVRIRNGRRKGELKSSTFLIVNWNV